MARAGASPSPSNSRNFERQAGFFSPTLFSPVFSFFLLFFSLFFFSLSFFSFFLFSFFSCGARLVIICILGPSCLDVSQVVVCPRSNRADSCDLSTSYFATSPGSRMPGQAEVREHTGLTPIACIARQLVTTCDETVTTAMRHVTR